MVSRSFKCTFFLIGTEHLRVLLITYHIIVIVVDADPSQLLRTYQDRIFIFLRLVLRHLILKSADHADLGLFRLFQFIDLVLHQIAFIKLFLGLAIFDGLVLDVDRW